MPHEIFLGGTIASNPWREEVVIPGLLACGIRQEDIFNPRVEHWTDEARQHGNEVKSSAAILLYVIASPAPGSGTANVSGYSIGEATMGLYDDPERTVVVFDLESMNSHTVKGMNKLASDLQRRHPHAPIFFSYELAMAWIVGRMDALR